ncbi:interleukin-21 isoform X2 [Stegastes partitus]|nr:PREDICTED: interleukin-21-like isoform X2 [Stegastes partitus]XP_008289230.1 PREDICTED: interleukin-21-like isoform X2 [Stegastes partitus]XP_008289237.1 PREDICTED: interleukin-21-like isoform X2 [Stegastes partitus]
MQRRKLQEVLLQLNDVKKSLQDSDKELNTPPKNIEDCCCLSALECFRDNLKSPFNMTAQRKQRKLFLSLMNQLTVRGLDFCNAGNATSTCQTCDSHPKEKAQEFFSRLESLIQRAIIKLSMN